MYPHNFSEMHFLLTTIRINMILFPGRKKNLTAVFQFIHAVICSSGGLTRKKGINSSKKNVNGKNRKVQGAQK